MGHGVVFSPPPLPFAVLEQMIGRVHQERERGLEHLVDLEPVERERERRFDQRDQGRDAKSGAGEIGIEPAERLDEPLLEADLLARLAQSGRARSFVRVDLAAGKGHLARVGAQGRGPQGQEDAQSAGPVDDRQKHRGRARRGEPGKLGRSRARSVVAHVLLRGPFELRQAERGPEPPLRQRAQRGRTRIGDKVAAQSPSISLAGHIGKKIPLERTPNQSWFATRSVRPRATRS